MRCPEIAAVGTPQEELEHDPDLVQLGRLTAALTERERELIALEVRSRYQQSTVIAK